MDQENANGTAGHGAGEAAAADGTLVTPPVGALVPPVRVLSDLHLGHSGCLIRDVDALRPLLEGCGTVVFNGDTVEQRADAFRSRSEEAFGRLTALCDELGVRARVVTGNHDPRITATHYLEIPERGIFITHGDCLFETISPWSKKIRGSLEAIHRIRAQHAGAAARSLDAHMEMTKAVGEVMHVFESELGPSLLNRFWTLAAEMWPPRRPWAILTSWLSAPGRAFRLVGRFRPETRVFIFGHTHFPGVWRRGGCAAVNTGGFLATLNARVVDIGTEDVVVRRVTRRGGAFHAAAGGGRRVG